MFCITPSTTFGRRGHEALAAGVTHLLRFEGHMIWAQIARIVRLRLAR